MKKLNHEEYLPVNRWRTEDMSENHSAALALAAEKLIEEK